MAAGKLNFNGIQMDECEQGSTWRVILWWEDSEESRIELLYYTAKMQVRQNYGKNLIVELSTENGRIEIDSNSNIILELSAEETSLIPPGKYLYDLELTDIEGKVYRLIEGEFSVKAEITL